MNFVQIAQIKAEPVINETDKKKNVFNNGSSYGQISTESIMHN